MTENEKNQKDLEREYQRLCRQFQRELTTAFVVIAGAMMSIGLGIGWLLVEVCRWMDP